MVMTLGVGNEIIEFLLHNYTGLQFSTAINDTWLDLVSNTVGAVLAGILLSKLIKEHSRSRARSLTKRALRRKVTR